MTGGNLYDHNARTFRPALRYRGDFRVGGREGLKLFWVWLKLRIPGLGNLEPGKTRKEPVLQSSTPCSSLAEGRRKARARISPGQFMALLLCGAWVCWFLGLRRNDVRKKAPAEIDAKLDENYAKLSQEHPKSNRRFPH